MARVLGIDPGLRRTGWGVIETVGNRLRHVGHGVVDTDSKASVPVRLCTLHEGLAQIVARYAPDEAVVEETFVNRNPDSTLKLGLARGVALLAPALAGLPVHEYAANRIKKALVGAGHADKEQVALMVRHLLPGVGDASAGRDRCARRGHLPCPCRRHSRPLAAGRGSRRRRSPAHDRQAARRAGQPRRRLGGGRRGRRGVSRPTAPPATLGFAAAAGARP